MPPPQKKEIKKYQRLVSNAIYKFETAHSNVSEKTTSIHPMEHYLASEAISVG